MEFGSASFLESLEVPAFVLSADGALAFANTSWIGLVGETADGAWSWLRVIAEEDQKRVRRVAERALREWRGGEVEFRARRTDGSQCVLAVALSPVGAEDAREGLVGLTWDVTERRRQEQRYVFMAGHDPLTGLANRRAFEEALQRSVSRAQRGATSALLMLDLDHLKTYNDAHGHLEGDQALVNFAMLLRSHVRASDLAARIGGDEFAILLEDADAEEALEIADRISATGLTEFVAGAREADLGVSGGLTAVDGSVDPRVVMDRADAALYAAKERGRHRVIVWEPGFGGLATPDRLAGRVQEALATDGFTLVYQPVVRLADRSVVYYESLVRLCDDGGEMLPPVEFLPALERSGLMPRLTRELLGKVLQALDENPRIAISMNLSASDLADELLLDDVEIAVDRSGVDAARVVFEISEYVLLADHVNGRQWIDRLAPRGCRFVLDGFGTGLGVFSLLREPDVEQVKLAREVVRALADSAQTREFVGAVRELIESQGKVAVVAFVETDELLADAREAGFEYGQGYRVREPSPDLPGLIAEMSSGGARDSAAASQGA